MRGTGEIASDDEPYITYRQAFSQRDFRSRVHVSQQCIAAPTVIGALAQSGHELLLRRLGRPVLYLLEPSYGQDRRAGEGVWKFPCQALQKGNDVTDILICK